MSFSELSEAERDQLVVNYLKGLVIDGVHHASSGHPGGAMSSMDFAYLLFREFLHWDPRDTFYFARDRFVLSAGHESMLLYALLYASDVLSLDDLKNFRQMNSSTPGHPENAITPHVECTTGPLGQGAAMSVGFAIASLHFSAQVESALFRTNTWALLGDGCMQEDVTLGAASYAGHLGLDNLIWFYDKNRAQISGSISRVTSDDERMIFEGFGWHVITLEDGHNHEDLRKAMNEALKVPDQPTLIVANTIMARGSHSLEGSHQTHGAPFKPDERAATKRKLGIPEDEEFYFPQEASDHFQKNFAQLISQARQKIDELAELKDDDEFYNIYLDYYRIHSERLAEIHWDREKEIATRSAFGDILYEWAPQLPQLIGGSADLEPSNMTQDFAAEYRDFQKNNRRGRNLAYGVREFPMACISNGLALYEPGLFIPFDATFLAFSDYMRPAIRLGSLQCAPVIHEFTHDSIYVGEDGPTHQPVEQLMSLRLIPNLYVIRPADGAELEAIMREAFSDITPTCLILSRQKLPPLTSIIPSLTREDYQAARRGAWVVREGRKPDSKQHPGPSTSPPSHSDHNRRNYVIYSTGSEVSLSLTVAEAVEHQRPGASVKVVSMLCWEIFEEQDQDYKDRVLAPRDARKISIEAGSTLGWHKYIGSNGLAIGVDDFGLSAPGKQVAEHFGFTTEAITANILTHPF